MLRTLLSILIIVGAGALSAPAFAHQQKAALTELLFNKRTGNLEVVHRFYLHDAEEAVRQLFGPEADIHLKEETRATFARYAINRFSAWDQNETPVELGFIGYEIEGNYFWVYQESEAPAGTLSALTIQHDVLRDLWPDQMNTVNVEGRGSIQTKLFNGENALEVFALPNEH